MVAHFYSIPVPGTDIIIPVQHTLLNSLRCLRKMGFKLFLLSVWVK